MISDLKPYPEYTDSGGPWVEEIQADILALENETEGLLSEIIGGAQ